MLLRFALPSAALLIAACAGGGGSFSGDYQDTQDSAPRTADSAVAKTNKSAQLLNEAIASTSERTAGSSGASSGGSSVGGFNCLGTFRCSAGTNLTGNVSTKPITLSLPGVCQYQGSGFNPDGTITSNGKVLGTWSQTSTGFTITESVTVTSNKSSTTVSVTLDCTKINDQFDPSAIGTGDDDDDIQAPPTPSSSGGTTVVVDAGTR